MTSLAENQQQHVAEAYAHCATIVRGHYENFPVASMLLPAKLRPSVAAIYAFARAADDFADEPGYTQDQRLKLLDDWHAELLRAADGEATKPVFIALADTLRRHRIPVELLAALLSAFKQDVVKHTYADFTELRDYCSRSANPVGRLILHLFGYQPQLHPELFALSDEICTGLQLANFWQDVAVDLKKPRVYLPQEELRTFGYSPELLTEHRCNDNFRKLMAFQVDRTERLLRHGSQLAELVRGRLRFELRLTCLGGLRILSKIRALDYDTLHTRPTLSAGDKLTLLVHATRGPVAPLPERDA